MHQDKQQVHSLQAKSQRVEDLMKHDGNTADFVLHFQYFLRAKETNKQSYTNKNSNTL